MAFTTSTSSTSISTSTTTSSTSISTSTTSTSTTTAIDNTIPVGGIDIQPQTYDPVAVQNYLVNDTIALVDDTVAMVGAFHGIPYKVIRTVVARRR